MVCSVMYCGVRSKHTLPELPYAYNALAPVISSEILELHHKKHHQTYVNNLNATEEKLKEAMAKNDLEAINTFSKAYNFNAGGHFNHSMYWENLCPGGSEPSGKLLQALNSTFGSFDNFRTLLMNQSNAVQGSGWGWLGYDKMTKQLRVVTSQNQELLLSSTGLVPLLAVDVWEHAYYPQYKNVRADYTKKLFDIVNWKDVAQRYEKAAGGGSCP
ncbi:superoxide dismutase [Mn], mitochondrial-like isoform X2 [Cimex lectularius]|uniref:Superoxide dismutase n=1 Tax=Cimex lectularius TaxID=79782 RepID=A0A8I6SIW8_CIMLE|nr:superoxide dismutase [Mn], mitochondrial-like isoform X2 [Cimex lectularius]